MGCVAGRSIRRDHAHNAAPLLANCKGESHLRRHLPALGAGAISNWIWLRYRVRPLILVIRHTFGSRLNYNSHLHIMVSAGGLRPACSDWLLVRDFDQRRNYGDVALRHNRVPVKSLCQKPFVVDRPSDSVREPYSEPRAKSVGRSHL